MADSSSFYMSSFLGGPSSASQQELSERSVAPANDLPEPAAQVLSIDTEPTEFSIFELTTRFDIPVSDLKTLQGVLTTDKNAAPRVSYGLGSGVSCSVFLHETMLDIDGEHRQTKIALKKYRQMPDDKESSKRLHRLLWQELKVFCHPYLRSHENICKLHLILWEDTSTIPVLGLEFALYGTLDDCLLDLRSFHSASRKSHLSLDIALGLEAIHVCGLVHGDIKPSNIIIQQHQSRTVVAKLSDFNGVGPSIEYGKTYTFGTPEWQAPEVLTQQRNIDWQLADVYSFAMVIATMWSRRGLIPKGGSFLDGILGLCEKLSYPSDIQRLRVNLMKFFSDSDNGSVDKDSVLKVASAMIEPPPGTVEDDYTVAALVVECGLRRHPAHRQCMANILAIAFDEFCQENGRTLPIARSTERNVEVESASRYFLYDGVEGQIAHSKAYSERTKPFQRMMFQKLLELGNCPPSYDDMFSMLAVEIGFEGTDKDLLETVSGHIKSLQFKNIGRKAEHFAQVATQLGMSYLQGLGTPVDELAGLEWLSKAATVGDMMISFCFGPVEESTGLYLNKRLPRKSWSTTGTIYGQMASAAYLKDLDPALHPLALRARQMRKWGPPKEHTMPEPSPGSPDQDKTSSLEQPGFPKEAEHRNEKPSSFLEQSPESPKQESKDIMGYAFCLCASAGTFQSVKYLYNLWGHSIINATSWYHTSPIFCATEANQPEIAWYLLEKGANVTLITVEGCAITHCLSFMDDEDAAQLAPLYVDRGAKLDLTATEKPKYLSDILQLGSGLPIQWAALKRKPLLLSALLQCHARKDRKVNFRSYCMLLGILAHRNEFEMLKLAVEAMERSVESIEFTQEPPPEHQDPDVSADSTLGHGSNPRREWTTSSSLYVQNSIRQGLYTDPTGPHLHTDAATSQEVDALAIAITSNDCEALQLFIDELMNRGDDVAALLADTERFGGYTALQQSIYHDARDVFMFLLANYPLLNFVEGLYRRTALHAAATQPWPGYVNELLKRGASLYDRSDDGSTPFVMAVMHNPSLEIADILADHWENMERVLSDDRHEEYHTAFGKVLNGLLTYRMGFGIERLKYLFENERFDKPSIFSWPSKNVTVFRALMLQHTSPTDAAQLALEDIVLKLLVVNFADSVDFVDFSGRSPLHYAVLYGHRSAVEILIAHKADVNLQTKLPNLEFWRSPNSGQNDNEEQTFNPNKMSGYTPLDLAVRCQDRGPHQRILQGGEREVAQWEKNMSNIISLLLANGADGSYQDMRTGILCMIAQVVKGLSVIRPSTKTKLESRTAEWPQRIPEDARGDDDDMVEVAIPPEGTMSVKRADAVEVIRFEGLRERVRRVDLHAMMSLLGAREKSVLTGSFWEEYPPASNEAIQSVRDKFASWRELATVGLALPEDWDVRKAPDGRLYYVDHENRTTSWTSPLVARSGTNDRE
ncbi:hypothetical protein CMUS01_14291 [Colletotrichum musicola]|uniref:Serine/threonine protein kinase n=1 Tax=Colletotrichum musicola TaxID=2175873 RepID=A0A8H6J5X7_9PEZI|nr:hypothetical protein CMUS01_14291 [Colletotrichum musicola]